MKGHIPLSCYGITTCEYFFSFSGDYMYNLPENSILKGFNLQSLTMTIRKFRMTRLI